MELSQLMMARMLLAPLVVPKEMSEEQALSHYIEYMYYTSIQEQRERRYRNESR